MNLERYTINDYSEKLQELDLLVTQKLFNKKDEQIDFLEYNSKSVQAGTLFVCKGAQFNRQYLLDAVDSGAVAYIAEKDYDLDLDIPHIIVTDIDQAMAPLASLYFNNPQKDLKIIGVGGTKGKTTTTHYIKELLDQKLISMNQPKAGILSSIHVYDGYETVDAINTTPIAIDLNKYLAKMLSAGIEYVVMEVSSQALKYHRTAGIEFEVGIFLNVDEDHISPMEHPDYQDYLESKAKMFTQTNRLIVNQETQEKAYILDKAKNANKYYTFSLKTNKADYYAYNIETRSLKNIFEVKTTHFNQKYTLGMTGRFNIENATASIATLDLLGFSQEHVSETLENIKIPGRMTISITNDKKIVGVVDYAHNRLSYKKLIASMNESYPGYKIVTVFGAPGEKALGRREELGTISGKYSDKVYLTAEDPGYEEVSKISQEIAKYIEAENGTYEIIEERDQAIRRAFSNISENTVLLVIGKGHEETLFVKGKYLSMQSDEAIIESCIQEYNKERK